MVGESARPWAAIGARAAAELYGCEILREGIEDEADNVTRFVWIAPAGTEPAARGRGRPRWSSPSSATTTPAPWSTPCSEFSSREINLTRIESRPLRQGLGRYMFFCDLEGALDDEPRRRGDRGAADQGRVGADPRLLSARLSAARRCPPTILAQHGTGAGAQCDV